MRLQSVTIGIIYASIAAGEISFTDLYEKSERSKQTFAFAFRKSGFLAAIDIFELKQRLIVDIVRVPLAHSSAGGSDRRPGIAENVASEQDRARDGIVDAFDQLRGEQLLLVH